MLQDLAKSIVPPVGCGSIIPAKSCWDAWRNISWWAFRWKWQIRQNFVAEFAQVLKHCLCNVQSGIVLEKNWAHSVDQFWLQALQCSVHLTDLLSVFLRCNGFARIQKAVVGQTNSRPQNSDHGLFLVQIWLWEVLLEHLSPA